MKNIIKKLLPPNIKDLNFWIIIAASFVPIMYICFNQKVAHMAFNFMILLFVCYIYLIRLIGKVKKKEKIIIPKSSALFLLFVMILWIFVGTFFAYNQKSAWLGIYNGRIGEVSVWQYIYLFILAVCAFNIKKENVKHILYSFIFVSLIMMIMQFILQDYHFGFVHRNFSGYYFCTTFAIAVGLILFSKSIKETIFLAITIVFHLINLTLNSSFGPILAVILYLTVLFIYCLIYRKNLLIKTFSICLSCLLIFAMFDYVKPLTKFRTENTPVIVQLKDVGIVGLNKVGIITDEKFENIKLEGGGLTPGSDGYDRFEMWERSIENMFEKPIFGVGAGSWWTYNPDMPVSCPHNEFVSYGSYFGIPVLILYVGCILYLFVSFRKKHKKQDGLTFIVFGAAIAYLVSSFFGNLFPFTAHIFYVMLGLMIKFVDVKDENQELEGNILSNCDKNKIITNGEGNE